MPDRSDEPLLAASLEAMRPFSAKAQAEVLEAVQRGSGALLLSPAMFLRLASPVGGHIDSAGRHRALKALLDARTPFGSPLSLGIVPGEDPEDAWSVIQHDGRHRAMLLDAQGVRWVPVVLESLAEPEHQGNCRDLRSLWSQYDDAIDEDEDGEGREQELIELKGPQIRHLRAGDVAAALTLQAAVDALAAERDALQAETVRPSADLPRVSPTRR